MGLSLVQEAKYQAVKNYVDHPGRNKLRIAVNFSVTPRTVDRWIANYTKFGKSAFIHGNTTLEPDCKIAVEVREKIVSLYRGDIYHGSNFAHFTELLAQHEDIHISEQSVRNILHAAGIHSPKMWRSTRKRLRQEEKQREKLLASEKKIADTLDPAEKNKVAPEDGHALRERSKYFGELIQMDASSYEWFGGLVSNLHVAIDDCTGRLTGAYFDKEETLFGYYNVLKQILLRYGIPAKFLTDKRTVFEYTRKGEQDVEKDTFTQFSYACKQLGIEIETTSVPEAKGRVERLNQTLQSRLPIIFRREGITDIDSANEFLCSHLDELFNDKFSMPVDHTRSVFEKQIGGKAIDEATVNLICSILCSRTLIGQCIRFNKKMYKLIDKNGVQQNYTDRTKVTVIQTLDNQLFASVNDVCIFKLEEVPVHAEKSRIFDADYEAPKPRRVYIPPMNHPWRYSEFEKHAKSQRHRIELELQKEDMFLDHLQDNLNAGYLIMGHRVA